MAKIQYYSFEGGISRPYLYPGLIQTPPEVYCYVGENLVECYYVHIGIVPEAIFLEFIAERTQIVYQVAGFFC
jgi:hypothetical protein